MRSKLTSVTAAAPLGLRERKKQQTRSLLHRAALDLVLEHGPDDVTVDQIAATLDYSDASAFTRAFMRWAGTTPSAWRENLASAAKKTSDSAAVPTAIDGVRPVA